MSDWSDAMDMYAFVARPEPDDTERAIICTIPGSPPSKSRARFSGKRVYASAQQVADERRTALHVAQVLKGQKFPGNVAIGAIFYRPTHQRVDADNMLKHVCDAINGLAFVDDSQVTSIYGRIELDRANPRTVLVIGPHRSTMTRGMNDHSPCAGCGQPIPLAKYLRSHGNTRFCSIKCRQQSRLVDLSKPVPCGHCERLFTRTTTAQTLCGQSCRTARMRGARKPKVRQLSNCSDCGKQLAHNRGGRCRGCWLLNGAKISKDTA